MHRKVVLALLLLSFFGLVACQNDNGNDDNTVTPAAATPLAVEPTEIVVTQVVTQETVVTRVEVEELIVTPTATPLPRGGDIVMASQADIRTLNPVLSNDGASAAALRQLFLSLLTLDPVTGAVVPQVAQDWAVSEDGLTYTFNLRSDVTWSDGTPLTAQDVAFTFTAITTPELNSPFLANVVNITSWQALNDATFEVKLGSPDCTTIYAFTVGILPAHVYDNDPANIPGSPEMLAPSVTSGPFLFDEYQPGQWVRLLANPAYYQGLPRLDSWTMQIYPNAIPMLNDLLAGSIDYTTVDAEFVNRVESAMARGAEVQIDKWFVNGFTYLAFNLADPTNPQNGWVDENEDGLYTLGEPIQSQDPHPILGDLAVRQAIAYALDYDEIITQAIYGQGGRVVADVSPAIDWAYNDTLSPYEQDLAQANALLDGAGWTVLPTPETTTNDETTPPPPPVRVRGEEQEPLALTITLNSGNPGRERVANLIKEQLEQVGFVVTIEILSFEEAVAKLRGQTFDMAITGWLDVNPEPDDAGFLSYTQDAVGLGFNFASYYNEAVETNLEQGRTVLGCAAADRAPFYQSNQELVYQDMPYVPLYAPLINVVWNNRLQNFRPNAWNLYENVQEWYVAE